MAAEALTISPLAEVARFPSRTRSLEFNPADWDLSDQQRQVLMAADQVELAGPGHNMIKTWHRTTTAEGKTVFLPGASPKLSPDHTSRTTLIKRAEEVEDPVAPSYAFSTVTFRPYTPPIPPPYPRRRPVTRF